jgi:hypothetical protein
VSKDCGGLGIRKLAYQNHRLLMKFVQKLHDPKHLPLGRTGSSSTRPLMKYLSCRIVQTKLPRFRSLTAVRLGDGRHISFWHDKWMLNSTLATLSPLSTPMLSDLNTQLLLFGDISGHLRSEKNWVHQVCKTHPVHTRLHCAPRVCPRDPRVRPTGLHSPDAEDTALDDAARWTRCPAQGDEDPMDRL